MANIPSNEAIEKLHAQLEKKQRHKECLKAWRKNNPEKYAAIHKKWRDKNKAKLKEYSQNRYKKLHPPKPKPVRQPKPKREPKSTSNISTPTWQHFVQSQWETLNRRTVNGDNPDWTNPKIARQLNEGTCLNFTYEELTKWCEERKDQIESMYKASNSFLYPSIDRIMTCDCDHYTLRNLQIVERRFNSTTCRKQRELV